MADYVSQIYEAVEAPERWGAFVASLAEGFHACHAAVVMADPRSATRDFLICTGGPSDLCCHVGLGKRDLLLCGLQRRPDIPVGQVAFCEDFSTDAGMLRKQACEHFHARYLGFRGMGAVLARNDQNLDGVALIRSKDCGAWTTVEARDFGALVPHLQRAVKLHRQLSEAETGLQHFLDHLPYGVLLLGTNGKVKLRNRTAQRLLDSEDGLAVTANGAVTGTSPEDTRALRNAILAACSGRAAGAMDTVTAVKICRPSGKRPLSVLIHRAGGDGLMGPASEPKIVLAVIGLESEWQPDANILMLLFDLTPSEARIAGLLANGLSLEEITGELSIRESTVKTHLRRIFEKTGTSRQAQLVSLLVRIGTTA